MSAPRSPRLLFTIGDVNGIGPEVLLKGLRSDLLRSICEPIVVGSERLLREYADLVALDDVAIEDGRIEVGSNSVPVIELSSEASLTLGETDALAGRLAGEAIHHAVRTLLAGEADGMVTMPISKEGLNLGGFDWPGHTEMIAHLCAADEPLMILLTEGLRVALATIHIPLASVADSITADLLTRRIRTFHRTLIDDFGLHSPRIGVLGLNPHAGEGGSIGREEIAIIRPALEELRSDGLSLDGPFPADGFFARYRPDDYDGVLAMYHDQGLIPLKMFARGGGVNVTGGLPIVRTSPDHGTAYAIAGRGIADERSVIEAALCAVEIARNRELRGARHKS